tara:strand:- start:2073 stop:2369 length:297 start_codon:yes stop_codon:yes gene_type:complete
MLYDLFGGSHDSLRAREEPEFRIVASVGSGKIESTNLLEVSVESAPPEVDSAPPAAGEGPTLSPPLIVIIAELEEQHTIKRPTPANIGIDIFVFITIV